MKKVQNYIEYFLVILIRAFISLLPLKQALAFGKGIGLFVFDILRIRRDVAIENIRRAFPDKDEKEVEQIARQTFVNFGMSIIEFMRLPQMTREYFKKKVTFVNAELLAEAMARGKGAILLSGHFGNWELMGAAIRSLGYPTEAIAREQRNTLINKIINQHRQAVGIKTIQLGMALRGVLKSLRQNNFIGILADQDAHDEGVFVDFLGRPSSTAPGPAIFALKTGAPIIFGTCVRMENGRHTVYLQNIDHSDLDGLNSENIHILTQRHASALEASIRKWPDHWFWMHKRWKTKPRVMADDEVNKTAVS